MLPFGFQFLMLTSPENKISVETCFLSYSDALDAYMLKFF